MDSWDDHERWPQGWPLRPRLLDRGRLALLEALGQRQFALAETMLDDLVAFARVWRPDMVVHDAVSYAGPVVASLFSGARVSHLWGSPGLQRLEMKELGDEPRRQGTSGSSSATAHRCSRGRTLGSIRARRAWV